MSRERKTRYVLLGILTWGPMSGYDMKKTIERSLGFFWQESYGQIYPMLAQLAAEGLAAKAVEAQDGRPDRHVYAITEAGRVALRAWLAQPTAPHRERVEVLVKLIFGQQVPPADNLAHLARFRAEHEALLAQYRQIEQRLEAASREHPAALYSLLTVRAGLRVSEAYCQWCDEATALVTDNGDFLNNSGTGGSHEPIAHP